MPSHQRVNLDNVAAAAARSFMSTASFGVRNGHLETFAVTVDGTLCHRWHVGGWSDWTPMPLPGSERAGHVGATAHGHWADLFVVTRTGRLLHRWWGHHEGWSGWTDWGGGFGGPITATSGNEYHSEVWVHQGGRLVHRWLINGTWSEWHPFS